MSISRTTAKSYLETGDTPTESQFADIMDAIPFIADGTFTALSSTTWDGSYKTKTLTANLALTFSSTKKSGCLIVTQDGTGSRTLSINGTSVTINTAADSKSVISFIYDEIAASYVFVVDTSIVGSISGGGGDTTAPTIVSATAIDATHIEIVFSESVTVTTAGWSFKKNGSALAITSVSGSGTTWSFLVATMAAGDTLLRSYNSGTGATVDTSSNELVSFTDQSVTNSIVGVTDLDFTGTNIQESPANTFTYVTANGAFNPGISDTVKAAAQGAIIYFKVEDSTCENVAIGFILGSAAVNTPAEYLAGFYISGGDGVLYTNCSIGQNAHGSFTVGRTYGVKVTATGDFSIVESTDDGVTWTTFFDMVSEVVDNTSALHINIQIHGAGGKKIPNPKILLL